jgi:hypothetical protein
MTDTRDLTLILNDGTEVLTSWRAPYTIPERVAFEEQFSMSFVVIERAVTAMQQGAMKKMWVVTCEMCPSTRVAADMVGAEKLKLEHAEDTATALHDVTITPPEDPDAEVAPADFIRETHMLFIAWHRARATSAGKVPGRFSQFLEVAKDFSFHEVEAEPETAILTPDETEVEPEVGEERPDPTTGGLPPSSPFSTSTTESLPASS